MAAHETDSVSTPSEKTGYANDTIDIARSNSKTEAADENGEVFQQAEYRALGWIRTTVILMKLCFATGVLAIPSAFSIVGYGPGIVLLAAWGALTTYYAYIMYAFRMRNPGVHNIADAADVLGGPIARDVAGALFLLTWILATGSGFIGLAQGFQVLSSRHVCMVVWTFVAAACTALLASIQTLGKLAILTWIGFASIFTAVFIVVVGVTQVDRPAAAPQEGPVGMEVLAVGHPGFVPGLVAAINLFAGFGSTPTFMPVIAEMRSPKLFTKSLYTSQAFLAACYISFGVVVYVGATIGISAVAFIIAGAVPFFSYLIGLIGSLCCAPTCLVIPAFMGLSLEWKSRKESKVKMATCCLHIFTVVLGLFITVSGTYTTIQSIVDAYNSGAVGKPFTCS
ncbi:hypothetical protein ACO1O0_007843 [Amphichorda felina]